MRTDFDVIVCGGGIAGVASALAAAREGADVCLLEKEYALGGLATLGIIVFYLALDDGAGVKMSGGICEELALLSMKYGPSSAPKAWLDPAGTLEERKKARYEIRYEAAPYILALEELLTEAGVTIFYDARLLDAKTENGSVTSVSIATKKGPVSMTAKAFIDATGDADLCFFAGENTVEFPHNSRTGWYFSFDAPTVNGSGHLQLHGQTDGYYPCPAEDKPHYTGIELDDISRHMLDMHKFILDDVKKKREENPNHYPLIIPSFHGLRTTRRLVTSLEFSDEKHERVWFEDAIGMIGNWKAWNKRYAISYRCIKGEKNDNLYAAGRCVSADRSGWDLTRVIPTCAVTGEAAGVAAAMQAHAGKAPEISALQTKLIEKGVLLDRTLFDRTL